MLLEAAEHIRHWKINQVIYIIQRYTSQICTQITHRNLIKLAHRHAADNHRHEVEVFILNKVKSKYMKQSRLCALTYRIKHEY